MDLSVFLGLLLCFLSIFFLIKTTRKSSNRLPPGSLGIPIIGQSLGLFRAMRENTAEKWFEERVQKYGPVSKMSLFGSPTVFIYGKAANKFVFASDSDTLNSKQPKQTQSLLGTRNLLELTDEDHKRVRRALMTFLKPEVLKQYVGKMDQEMRENLEMHWQGKQKVTAMPIMKTLTFNIMWSLLLGLEAGARRQKFIDSFEHLLEGSWSIPLNLPFTRYNRSLKATSRIQSLIREIVHEKRMSLEKKQSSANQDLISSLLCIKGEDSEPLLSEQEIVENVLLVMVAGYDTSSILITFMIRLLATDPVVYAAVAQEQEEIAKGKSSEEPLTWEDVTKMKYTWKVALEVLRMTPPIFGTFRKTSKDVEFGGYLIPKGWQIYWSAHMTHMDESIFAEPSKFDPDRFDNQKSIPPYCFVGFGSGPRACPGNEFARIEVLVVMHYLVTRFSWKLCGKDNNFSRIPLPAPTEGLPIQIEPKKIF